MKLPRWNGAQSPSVYLFASLCFVVGYVAVRGLSFGQIAYDERDGEGWSPLSKMPDGKTGISGAALKSLGFVVIGLLFAAYFGLGLIWNHIRLS
ncbi:MAG: hypothetical protein SH859_17265 [Hyphomicrobium aestuarii]|nr:hypothetical protein [Hyphomicrobium aestuarii]